MWAGIPLQNTMQDVSFETPIKQTLPIFCSRMVSMPAAIFGFAEQQATIIVLQMIASWLPSQLCRPVLLRNSNMHERSDHSYVCSLWVVVTEAVPKSPNCAKMVESKSNEEEGP